MSSIFDRENYVTFWEVCTLRTMIRKSILKKLSVTFSNSIIYLVLPATHKSIKILIISLYGGLPRFSTNLEFIFP